MIALRFGPLRYVVRDELGDLPGLASYVDRDPRGEALEVSNATWREVLSDRVARDSIRVGALVLHAGAIDTAGGALLLVAAPGTGKSTRVAAAGARALADNSVLVQVEPTVKMWTLPFAGGDAHASPSAARDRIAFVAELGRSEQTVVRSLPETELSFTLTRAIVWPLEDERDRAERARLGLEFVGKIRGIRLDTPPDAGYLSVVDQLLGSARVSRATSATWREIDGQVVVISVDVHRVRLLNNVGAFVWQRCDGRPVSELVEALCEQFDVTRDTALRDVLAFVDDMRDRGLVTVEA
jgi:hypothetical protein